MDIYIDNKKVTIRKKNFSNLGVAIFEINKKLLKENKILNQIYVNGEILKDHSIVNIEDLKTIEIITKSYSGVILESVLNTKKYIDNYFEVFDSLYDFDDDNSITFDEIDLLEITLFLNWFYNLLLLIKENYIFKFIRDDYEEYMENFRLSLQSVEILYKKGQFDEMFTELETITNYFLMDFYNNVDDYIDDILQEENKKSLLN